MNWMERAFLWRAATRNPPAYQQGQQGRGCLGCGCLPIMVLIVVLVIAMAVN